MKKVLMTLLVLVLLGAAGAGGFWFWREQQLKAFVAEPFGSPEPKLVEVPPGSGPTKLASLLTAAGIVSDSDLFYRYVRKENAGPKLKAGEYEFTGALKPPEVLAKITAGDVKKYRFTVPEGLRVEEILPIVAASELKLDLEKL
ncbi:MAG: endolytic transglycosylase MltG, partial [Myxococcaceae bacterium]